jgi:hypothetical protein
MLYLDRGGWQHVWLAVASTGIVPHWKSLTGLSRELRKLSGMVASLASSILKLTGESTSKKAVSDLEVTSWPSQGFS